MSPEQIYTDAFAHGLRFSGVIVLSAAVALALWRRGTERNRGFATMTWSWCLVNTIVAILWFNHIRIPSPDQIVFVQDHLVYWMQINLAFDGFVLISGSLAYFIGKVWRAGDVFLGLAAGWATQGLLLALLDAFFMWS